jgi:hypothetical protein
MNAGKKIKNLAASVRARLLNIARQYHIDFNRVLLMYFQECFLNRLACSKYKKQFVLKGGLLFYALDPLIARPTKDIDFLGQGILNKPNEIERIIHEILTIQLPDGVSFLTESLHSEIIAKRKSYSGVRIFVIAELSKARQNLQIDVGFGDTIVPKPVAFAYPALLTDKTIKLYAYSWYSVISEKIEAIVNLNELSSRLKDYYDIHYLQNRFNFEGDKLRKAMAETFTRRGTDISGADYIFSENFAESIDKQKQWSAFLHKNNLAGTEEFPLIMKQLKAFLLPVATAIAHQEPFHLTWDFKKKQWN